MSAHEGQAETDRGVLRHALAWNAWFGLLFALWLMLIDNTPLDDMVNGLVCSAIGATAAQIVDAQRLVRVAIRPRWLLRLWRPVLSLVTDTIKVTLALLGHVLLRRKVRGHFRAVRYDGGGGDSLDSGRRVLSEWAASLAPNRYSIGIADDYMLVHELLPDDGPLDPMELG